MSSRPSAYVPSLDGVRALAVLAVLVYHAESSWLPAGFLGVDVFFVLSGYLITSILLSEHERGGIDLKHFWLRRARRLLPALYVLVAATLAYAIVALPDEVASLRTAALAAAGYVTNWYLIAAQQSYFEAMGRPSLLKHLWSLAVEEQFYLLWPPLLALALRQWSGPTVFRATLLASLVSTVLMAALYVPDGDPSRVYYGTDTRIATLLVGGALAFVWPRGRSRHWTSGLSGWLAALGFDLLGIVALGALVAAAFLLDEFEPLLYRGGFAAVALASAALVATCMHPGTRIASLLGHEPLRWIGTRSYSIYLWHWPVFAVTRPEIDTIMNGIQLVIVRLILTLALAEASYRYVESPIRSGLLGRTWARLRAPREPGYAHFAVRLAATSLLVSVGLTLVIVSAATARTSATPELPANAVNTWATSSAPVESAPGSAGAATTPARPATQAMVRLSNPNGARAAKSGGRGVAATISTAVPSATPLEAAAPRVAPRQSRPPGLIAAANAEGLDVRTGSRGAPGGWPTSGPGGWLAPRQPTTVGTQAATPASADADSTPVPAQAGSNPQPYQPARVSALGDSVMLGAVNELALYVPGIGVDVAVSRQVSTAIQILQAHLAAGDLGDVVVLHIGNNGTFTSAQFDTIMNVLRRVPRVIFVNLRVPRAWEAPNNAVIADGVSRYPNAVLVDWRGASAGRADLLYTDGIHLRPAGAAFYSALITDAVYAPLGPVDETPGEDSTEGVMSGT